MNPIDCDKKRGVTKYSVEVPCGDCGYTITKEFQNGPNAVAWYSENINRVCERCQYKRLCD